jgi:hypothetical protein
LVVMLPTRHWLAALLVAGGELALVWGYLPGNSAGGSSRQVLLGSVLLLAAALSAMSRPRRAAALPHNRLWLDFRDSFGALWAARVLERVNAAAAMYAWPVRLGWNGFHAADNPSRLAEIPPEIEATVRKNLVGLLRRFVSQEWIERRLA